MLTATARHLARLLAAAFVVGRVAGCAISPKPEPPLDPGPTVDLGQVETIPSDGFGPWLVAAGPGAASPAGAEIHVTNLETELDPVLGTVAGDGSFEVEILADEGDEVRLQLVTDTLRSAPIDFLVGAQPGSALPAPRPLGDCLTLTPAAELDAALQSAVTVHNGCAGAVELEAPALRRAVAGLSYGPIDGWPSTVEPGQSITLTISFQAAADAFEEILFVRASTPTADRRPITVWPAIP